MAQITRPCNGCGELVYRTKPTGPISNYCQTCRPAARTTCVTCGVEVGLSARKNGHKSGPARKYCSDACKPVCVVVGCNRPKRKREWCANHYATWFARGDAEAPLKYQWAAERRCLTCGTTDIEHWERVGRKFCSDRCKVTWAKYNGEVPIKFNCIICGMEVNYFNPITRKRLRSDSAYCAAHIRHARIYISVETIALEDGFDCRLCGEAVDMSISTPDRMSPSIDHIVPRAQGGSDYRDNLQLAHRGCNSSKRHLYVE